MEYGKLYGKEILNSTFMNIDGDYFNCYILDDGEYYNIHIVDDFYKKDELNTLRLQEPKECVSLEDLDEMFMQEQILEHYLWHKFYGFKDKSYSFTVSHEVDTDFTKEN